MYVLLDQSCDAVTEEYSDHGFSITWNETLVGVTAEAACTGAGLSGNMNNSSYICKYVSIAAWNHMHHFWCGKYQPYVMLAQWEGFLA